MTSGKAIGFGQRGREAEACTTLGSNQVLTSQVHRLKKCVSLLPFYHDRFMDFLKAQYDNGFNFDATEKS
jgi:hypothetical protein